METPSLNSPTPQLSGNGPNPEGALMLNSENKASDAVLSAVKAWETESCRLHSDVSAVFDLACGILRGDSGWILVAVAPAQEYTSEAANALTLGACRALRGVDVPNGFYVTRKLESRSTVLDIRHIRIERFGEEPTEESVAFENVNRHSPGEVIHLNAIGFFAVPGKTSLEWDSSIALPTEGNDIGSVRIASSLSGAVPSVAMLEQSAATLIHSAKKPVNDLADLLCRKPMSDAQITRKAILTFSHVD
jgi:hypothetical protein